MPIPEHLAAELPHMMLDNEPRWTFQVRRMGDGSICVTLGDREHAMSERQADILRGMLETVCANHRDHAWFPKQ